jgi:hypothetical protein
MLITYKELPPFEMKYNGKKSYEYDIYNWDDFILKIRKHYDLDGCKFYEVIYEDAYGEWDGTLLTKEQIKNKYNLIIE